MEMESKSSSSSKPLHHFALPDGLKWGNHKFSRCMKVNSNGKISTVVRLPSSSSSSSAEAASVTTRVYNNSDRFLPSGLGKFKEREEFIDRPSSPAAAVHRRGSDFKKSGFDFKIRPAPSLDYTESYRKLKSITSLGGGGGVSREGDGIAAVREKIMFDLQAEADKMKNAILGNGLDTSDQVDDSNHTPPVSSVSPVNNASPSNAITSWNLRTRRAACKALQPPNGAGTSCVAGGNVSVVPGQGLNYNAMMISDPKYPSLITEKNKTTRQRRSGGATTPSIKANERAKFSVTLTKQEIEDDFLAFAARRPYRRPRKRPRYIQKGMDTLFPGLWLTEITADMYTVVEKP